MNKGKKIIIVSFVSLFMAIFMSLFFGAVKISFLDIVKELFNKGSTQYSTILWSIRIPRLISALLIGAGLAVAGAVFQAIFRNPLVEPYTVGVSGGAALGAAVLILMGLQLLVPIGSFIGGIAVGTVVYLVGKRFFDVRLGILLVGVMISFLCSGLIMLIMALNQNMQIYQVLMWIMGAVRSVGWGFNGLMFLILGICIAYLISQADKINAILLGEEYAIQVGVNINCFRKMLFFIGIVITSLCVCMGGIIGFVGLIIPHCVRLLLGNDYKYLIILSVVWGAIFLSISDVAARLLIQPYELPVGVITGIVGALLFIFILLKTSIWSNKC